MHSQYHTQITSQALAGKVSPLALQTILQANLHQDSFRYQFGHSHFHFDNNAIEAGYAYLDDQRQTIWDVLQNHIPVHKAWQAFGRMTHALQDFYAHSNYLTLWVERFAPEGFTAALSEVDPLAPEIIDNPRLHTGRFLLPWGALVMIRGLKPLLEHLLPPDTHTNMNLDDPTRGPLFPLALVAARKRTEIEFEGLTSKMDHPTRATFTGLKIEND